MHRDSPRMWKCRRKERTNCQLEKYSRSIAEQCSGSYRGFNPSLTRLSTQEGSVDFENLNHHLSLVGCFQMYWTLSSRNMSSEALLLHCRPQSTTCNNSVEPNMRLSKCRVSRAHSMSSDFGQKGVQRTASVVQTWPIRQSQVSRQ